jgi:hypothetical protein
MTRFLHRIICWSALLLLLLSVGCTSGIQQFKEPLKSPVIVKRHCELIGHPGWNRYRGFDLSMDEAMVLEFRLGLEVIAVGELQEGARMFSQGIGKHGRF